MKRYLHKITKRACHTNSVRDVSEITPIAGDYINTGDVGPDDEKFDLSEGTPWRLVSVVHTGVELLYFWEMEV